MQCGNRPRLPPAAAKKCSPPPPDLFQVNRLSKPQGSVRQSPNKTLGGSDEIKIAQLNRAIISERASGDGLKDDFCEAGGEKADANCMAPLCSDA